MANYVQEPDEKEVPEARQDDTKGQEAAQDDPGHLCQLPGLLSAHHFSQGDAHPFFWLFFNLR